MDSGSCILWIWMQPETCPVPAKVSLPAHPRLVLVTKRLRACSLSSSPISLSASIILKPNTSPHLHLDFIEKFSCLKFKTVEIFIIITESIVIQSSTKAMYCWIRNTQQHAQPWIQVQTVYLVYQNYILVDKNHSTDTLRDHARKKIKLMSMIVFLLKSLILVKKLLTDELGKHSKHRRIGILIKWTQIRWDSWNCHWSSSIPHKNYWHCTIKNFKPITSDLIKVCRYKKSVFIHTFFT